MAHRQTAERNPLFSATVSDPRADRGRREIAVDTQTVTIRRRYRGVDMRLSLAVTAYRGVALCLVPQGDALIYEVRLVHRDSELSVPLDAAATDADIVADWRLWGRVLNLPLLVEREIGAYEFAEAGLAAGPSPRRKRPLKRRPRFLGRRKAGDTGRMAIAFTGEREIIARS